ncbi:iron-containing redox enzyme family protein [Vibrio alginolyticus]
MQATTRFRLPKLRNGTICTQHNESYHIDYRNQGVVITWDGGDGVLGEFLNDLMIGQKDIKTLSLDYPALEECINEIIEQLDNNYLLTESNFEVSADVISGEQFANKLRRYSYARHSQLGTSKLYELMLNDKVTSAQLIGYVVEYYHIVKSAPSVIAPALAHKAPEAIFQGIKTLFLEEHDHDQLLVQALESVGLLEDEVRSTTPLPSTFSVYSTLGTFSRQHLLSFISALFLFEEPYPEFNRAFIASCKRLNLPEAFWKPIVGHSDVNESGGHHLITDELLTHISAISKEEANVTLIHIMTLLETMKIWDSEICSSYQHDVNLRIFS